MLKHNLRIGFGIAVLSGCLGLAGCQLLDSDKDDLPNDPAFDLPRQYRAPDKSGEPVGLSTKSQQIEHNLGIR
jgi:hypothetical protein